MKSSKQRASIDVRKFFFRQRVVNEWNLLLQEVVDATSVNQFKNRLDNIRQRYGYQKHGLTSPSMDKYKYKYVCMVVTNLVAELIGAVNRSGCSHYLYQGREDREDTQHHECHNLHSM